jgi:hypothetical protein
VKLPFRLIVKTAQFLSDLDIVSYDDRSNLYCDYLTLSGWTEIEYERALLDFIDENWEATLS